MARLFAQPGFSGIVKGIAIWQAGNATKEGEMNADELGVKFNLGEFKVGLTLVHAMLLHGSDDAHEDMETGAVLETETAIYFTFDEGNSFAVYSFDEEGELVTEYIGEAQCGDKPEEVADSGEALPTDYVTQGQPGATSES
jgi:hypothetical protein